MSENTTTEAGMNKERIAELRETARQWFETRHVTYADKLIECIDALEAAQAELADIRESMAWLATVDPDEIKDEELHHAALIDFRRWERISRHPGAVGNPVYSFEDFLIPHARAQGEKKAQAELATVTTEIAERNDTIDTLRNDVAALRVQLAAARERIREIGARVEVAYREGYHQRGADEFGVSTKGSTPDVDFAWGHSEAKQGVSSSRVAGEAWDTMDKAPTDRWAKALLTDCDGRVGEGYLDGEWVWRYNEKLAFPVAWRPMPEPPLRATKEVGNR